MHTPSSGTGAIDFHVIQFKDTADISLIVDEIVNGRKAKHRTMWPQHKITGRGVKQPGCHGSAGHGRCTAWEPKTDLPWWEYSRWHKPRISTEQDQWIQLIHAWMAQLKNHPWGKEYMFLKCNEWPKAKEEPMPPEQKIIPPIPALWHDRCLIHTMMQYRCLAL